MSTPSPPIAPPRKPRNVSAWARRLAAFAAACAIVALALGPRGRRAVAHLAATRSWAPHAPDLGLFAQQSLVLQAHVIAILAAFAVGTVLMLRVKGTRAHRRLGWTWVALMTAAAISGFLIAPPFLRGWSLLHVFVPVTLISLAMGLRAIRARRTAAHARWMTGLYFGGLVFNFAIAFIPGRLMWRMVFG